MTNKRANQTPTPANRIFRSLLTFDLAVSVDADWNVICPITAENWGNCFSDPLRQKLSPAGSRLYQDLLAELRKVDGPLVDVGKALTGELQTIWRFKNLRELSPKVRKMLRQVDSDSTLLTRKGLAAFVKDQRFTYSATLMLEKCQHIRESGREVSDAEAGRLFRMYDANRRLRQSLRSLPDFRR